MKQSLRHFVLSLCFFCSTAFVSQAQSNATVNGGGTAVEFGVKSTFVFNAVRHKDGWVNGHLVYHLRAFDVTFHLAIDCMQIDGNRATLSGAVTSVSGSNIPFYIFPGSRASFSVQDNGKGGNKDRISDVFFGAQCWDDLDTYLSVQGNLSIKE